MVRGYGYIYGFMYMFIGVCLIVVFLCLIGKYFLEIGLCVIGIFKVNNFICILWNIVMLSVFVGSVSYVVLDVLMYVDVEFFYLIFVDNLWLGVIFVSLFYKLCLYSGLVGGGMFYVV